MKRLFVRQLETRQLQSFEVHRELSRKPMEHWCEIVVHIYCVTFLAYIVDCVYRVKQNYNRLCVWEPQSKNG